MLGILRKDYLFFALGALAIFPLVLVVEALVWPQLRVASLVTNLVLTWLLALGPLMVNEMDEERSSGYVLLSILPVRASEVVAAKYLLLLGAVAACAVSQMAFLTMVQAAPALLAIAHSTVWLNSTACLLSGAIAYTGIFGLGYARFTVVSLTAFTALGLIPPILLSMGKTAALELLGRVAAFLMALDGACVVLLGLALCALLFLVSVALFRREPHKKYIPRG